MAALLKARCTRVGTCPHGPVPRGMSPLPLRSGRRPVLVRASDNDLLQEPCPVPTDQRPMQEFLELQKEFLFDLPTMPLPAFALRLAGLTGVFLALSFPISCVTFSVQDELLQVVAASCLGSLFVTLVLVLRLYLGYNHVSSRLLSATVEYEETGWYDGEVWVKTPQMLMRDRLLGIYQVQPILTKVKQALLGLSGAMVASIVLLAASPPPKAYSYNNPTSSASYRTARSVAQVNQPDYQDRVEVFEPWSLQDEAGVVDADDGDDALSSRPSIMDHMRMPSALP